MSVQFINRSNSGGMQFKNVNNSGKAIFSVSGSTTTTAYFNSYNVDTNCSQSFRETAYSTVPYSDGYYDYDGTLVYIENIAGPVTGSDYSNILVPSSCTPPTTTTTTTTSTTTTTTTAALHYNYASGTGAAACTNWNTLTNPVTNIAFVGGADLCTATSFTSDILLGDGTYYVSDGNFFRRFSAVSNVFTFTAACSPCV